ncbi:MAG TPA: hypothetical protein VGP46_06975, partial [Acidimicrobiales bacterium]|nr:hypothetical protein [Acidimicrobiales bacterium]
LDTGSAASPVATIDVTFKATGHKASACLSGSETVYTGTLTGEAKLVTGLAGGGTVGGSGLNFNVSIEGSKPTVTVDNNCDTAFPCPTSNSYAFSVFPSVQSDILAEGINTTYSHKAYDFVTISKGGMLAKPAGAETEAIAFVYASPLKWTKATKTMTVTTTASGLVTGSATLVGGKSDSFKFPCTLSGKQSSTTEIAYDADMTSPAGHVLTAHMTIGSKVALPASVKSGISNVVNIIIVLGK